MTPDIMPASKPNRKPPKDTTNAIKSVFLVIGIVYLFSVSWLVIGKIEHNRFP